MEELYTTEDEMERLLKTEMCYTKTFMTQRSKVRGEGGFPRRSLFDIPPISLMLREMTYREPCYC